MQPQEKNMSNTRLLIIMATALLTFLVLSSWLLLWQASYKSLAVAVPILILFGAGLGAILLKAIQDRDK
jgi:CHASE2 domain-containing sensor protein